MHMKRGYIYTLDVAIAILIIIIGIISFVSIYAFDPDTEATQRFTTELLATLDTIQLASLCDDPLACDCGYDTVRDMCFEGNIRMDQSILSGFGELYYRGEREAIERIVDEVLVDVDLVPPQYGFKLHLEDDGEIHQLYPLIEVI